MNSLDQVINLKVRITNLLDESITGTIYAFSEQKKVLALKINLPPSEKSLPPPEGTYKIMNTAFIKAVTILPPFPKRGQPPSTQRSNIPQIDIQKLEIALNRAIEAAKGQPAQILSQSSPPATGKPVNAANKKSNDKPVAFKIFDKLALKLGKENVQWQGSDSILLFKEIAISKPYALNKISNSKRTQSSKHLERARSALREVWLSDDNLKRGG